LPGIQQATFRQPKPSGLASAGGSIHTAHRSPFCRGRKRTGFWAVNGKDFAKDAAAAGGGFAVAGLSASFRVGKGESTTFAEAATGGGFN
jgi:hypothetical protein